ncbi:MAG: NAD-dependent epimerase/dehydratase family protein [Pirellulales bacterium]
MNVFVAGSTGVLGRRLVQQFSERGHRVTALVRSRAGERLVASLGGTPRFADLFDSAALVHAAEGADVVIHAATAIPVKTRTSPRDWEPNDRIRREGTASLAECAGRIGAKQFIFESIVWVARPADDSEFDEDSSAAGDPHIQSALDGERIAQEAAGRGGFAGCVLRCGWFYSSDSAQTQMMVDGLKRRRFPIIGTGDAVWRMLHPDDAAGAFVAAAESGKGGLWHVVDDEPVTAAEFLTALAQRFSAPPPRRVPVWLARLMAGRAAAEFFTRSTRTTADRFKRDIGWQPQFPTYRAGIEEIER